MLQQGRNKVCVYERERVKERESLSGVQAYRAMGENIPPPFLLCVHFPPPFHSPLLPRLKNHTQISSSSSSDAAADVEATKPFFVLPFSACGCACVGEREREYTPRTVFIAFLCIVRLNQKSRNLAKTW